jgi:hypothetical protein
MASSTASGLAGILADALREAARIPGALAVQVLGHQSGTVFLNDGHVTGAECSGTPDIRTRLIRSGFADDHAGTTGTGEPDVLREDLRNRLADGSVSVEEIERLALSVILDAVQSLTHPPGAAPPRLRIHRGRQSAHGIDTRVPLEDVLAAIEERASAAHRLAAGPDTALSLCRLGRPGVVVDAEQWRILARVNGRLTPRDLAWATGSELFATLLTVDHLAAEGLCTAPSASGAASANPEPGAVADPQPATVVPQRRWNTPPDGLARTVFAAPEEWADDLTADVPVDADIIQRLVTGLRALG